MNRPATNRALLRGVTRRRFDRRAALRLGATAAGGVAASAALAACGVQSQRQEPMTEAQAREFWASQRQHGTANFANWPLYMDADRTPLKEFTARTGITVNYSEPINDMPSWFGKIQPQLAAGQSIGYDLIMISSGVTFTKLRALGYFVPLDRSRLPNFTANAGEQYRHSTFDPGNIYSIPYTAGITGIAYNPKYVKRKITSIADLWDPAFAGRVGMFADSDEMANFGLMRIGVAPEKSTPDDWRRAAKVLREQRDAGLVRAYYNQNYVKPLAGGDIWLTMAWSGDVFQQNISENTGLEFVIPEEGGTLWTDNMTIPRGAENPLDAMTLMDNFYAPPVAAQLTEIINYISPVPAVHDLIAAHAEGATGEEKDTLTTLAESPLLFPTEAEYARLHPFGDRTPVQDRLFQGLFEPISEG
ncbi:polyamine ABC transporter substrate-binding protein [Pseudonocardia acaciae]|uniref:polyamine ABC transporter substrate-binding protein n=1 Tax=Pseudonocardia acaciae TaxID=551276 RepID=UPI00049090D4|nr:spermidine/putrescine ABC transporter substrate-binding protein [Pseudonocardia acaciae]